MPIYEYCCPDCELRFESLRPQSQANDEALCPRCNGVATRILSCFTSFSKSGEGASIPIGGGSSCGTCSAASCGTCRP
ncbi:MAG: zinc ribbon domain-containing protein [Dehalococcoidia bacterium]|nr:zinc ribbon domain-containing protein [Dehalococcoidia bacterium]